MITKLYDFMSRFGVPHTLVSDNGTSFISHEFKHFCLVNGIKHMLSPAYHPASNGQAESFVKIIKRGLKSIILQGCNKKNIAEKLAKFLFDYRNSKNSTTEKSPAELVYGRTLRSRLDLLNSTPFASSSSPSPTALTRTVEHNQSLQAKNYKGTKREGFKENATVWVTKNINNNKKYWIEGIVKEKVGQVLYKIYIPHLDCVITRHIDQIRLRLCNSQSDNRRWDPDVVPDLMPPDGSYSEAIAHPEGGGEPPMESCQESSASEEVTNEPVTPLCTTRSRRRAISPVYSTPT